MTNWNLLPLFAAVSLASIGCSGEKKAAAAQPETRKEGSVAPRPAVVTPSAQHYRAMAVTSGGTLTGTVDFTGVFPRDTTFIPTAEQPRCGPSVVVRRVEHTGTKVAGAIVWLADIRAGKGFPLERRVELLNEHCLFSPRVQAAFAGTTLNVATDDIAHHRNRIINVGTGDLEGIAPFNDNGQVIPFDKLFTKPAQLEIGCDMHPWSRAWILVFDHPYYATTQKNGTFEIGAIPPGTYRVRAWHPELGLSEQTVSITAGQTAALPLQIAGSAGAATQLPDSAAAPTQRQLPK